MPGYEQLVQSSNSEVVQNFLSAFSQISLHSSTSKTPRTTLMKLYRLFGYDQGVMGGLLTLPSFVQTFPEINTNNDSSNYRATIQGIAVASYNVGCFIGAVITIFIGDILGRRRMIFVGSAIMVIGANLQASSFSLGQLIAGRVITGFGNGMNTSTVPTWASETSKSHKRGKMVMIEGAMITGGIMLSYWIDFGFSFLEPSTIAWRFPIAFQIVFALLLLVFILELPESPRCVKPFLLLLKPLLHNMKNKDTNQKPQLAHPQRPRG